MCGFSQNVGDSKGEIQRSLKFATKKLLVCLSQRLLKKTIALKTCPEDSIKSLNHVWLGLWPGDQRLFCITQSSETWGEKCLTQLFKQKDGNVLLVFLVSHLRKKEVPYVSIKFLSYNTSGKSAPNGEVHELVKSCVSLSWTFRWNRLNLQSEWKAVWRKKSHTKNCPCYLHIGTSLQV